MKASVLLALLLLAACDAAKPYPDLPDKNLRVQTASAGAKVTMGIYDLGAGCGGEYEGTVVLDQPVVYVGLPPDRRSRLVLEFRSPGLLERTPIKKEALLLLRKGYRYDALVTYKEGLYGLGLREIDPNTGEARDLDPMAGC